ncbi:tetraspanin-10-like [Denticeps clupeoides]|uniref:Tetraspanin-10 n=1 Tax=Denticeps clupeoides TaxID=299321 RepID=A0AAY4CZX0_9TELE|nr:tetraspanin-10-like [Denticeps clupeoides]
MKKLQVLWRLPFPWRERGTAEDGETSLLVPKEKSKGETATAVTYQGTENTAQAGSEEAQIGDGSGDLLSHQPQRPTSVRSCLLKNALFISNLFFTVMGLVVLGMGLWGLITKESFAQERIGHIGTDPMLVFVFLGLTLCLLCLMGCVGSLRENSCLLRLFSGAVLILVAAQVLVAIAAYSLQDQIVPVLRSGMLMAMVRYQDDLDMRFITDEIQMNLQCCGADNYRDWEMNLYYNCSAPGVQACGVPASCCIDPLENGTVWNSQCGVGAQQLVEFSAQSVIYLGGCLGGIARWIEQNKQLIGIVGIALLGVQILTLIVTTRLLDNIQWSKAISSQRDVES